MHILVQPLLFPVGETVDAYPYMVCEASYGTATTLIVGEYANAGNWA